MGSCFSTTKEIELPRYESEAEQVRHGRNMSNHYTVYYPAHAPRTNSNLYNKTHAQLKTQPCFVCGKTTADGLHVETHHYYCEKAFQNAYDWKKFGKFAQTCYTPQGIKLATLFNWDEVAADPDLFVDSPYNMIVLCKEHHTSGGRGIHHVPYPDWIAQKFAKDGVQVLG